MDEFNKYYSGGVQFGYDVVNPSQSVLDTLHKEFSNNMLMMDLKVNRLNDRIEQDSTKNNELINYLLAQEEIFKEFIKWHHSVSVFKRLWWNITNKDIFEKFLENKK